MEEEEEVMEVAVMVVGSGFEAAVKAGSGAGCASLAAVKAAAVVVVVEALLKAEGA